MVRVSVLGETPEEEFEEVAERAYSRVPKDKIAGAQTETELSQLLIDEYFGEKVSTSGQREYLLPGINRVFKKRGWWEPQKFKVPEFPKVTAEEEKPVVVQKKPEVSVRKPKVERVKISAESSDEELERYVEHRPIRARKGKLRYVTKSRKSLSKEAYIKRLRNLSKGWKLSKTRKGLSKKNS